MCLFCKIINKEIPCYKIYEDEFVLAFLDISQANIGHTLVVPKKHFDNILDIDDMTLERCITVAKKIAKKIEEAYGIKDFNILNNCGSIAGQTINHFHIHVLPRIENDNIEMKFSSNNLSEDSFNDIVKKLAF